MRSTFVWAALLVGLQASPAAAYSACAGRVLNFTIVGTEDSTSREIVMVLRTLQGDVSMRIGAGVNPAAFTVLGDTMLTAYRTQERVGITYQITPAQTRDVVQIWLGRGYAYPPTCAAFANPPG